MKTQMQNLKSEIRNPKSEDHKRVGGRRFGFRIPVFALLVLLSTLNLPPSTFAQGSLTPPGPPAPTMKSLAQIEPRTPISSAPFTISAPGAYYLTTNLNVATGDAITITTNDVTLDLNGFTISSMASSATGTAILLAGGDTDITILNGHIKGGVTNGVSGVYGGSGFNNGISYSGQIPQAVRVSGISVSGCLNYGININSGNSTVIESCTAHSIGNYGLYGSSVSHSSASLCGGYAVLGLTISDCSGFATGSGVGLSAGTASNCYGRSTGSGNGLEATTANCCEGVSVGGIGLTATTANNCLGSSTSNTGLNAARVAIGCNGISASGTGLNATIANSCTGSSVTAVNKYNMP